MSKPRSLLDKAGETTPTLNYAVELTRLASTVGFDWPDVEGVISKIHEELNEVQHEIQHGLIPERLHDEIGDLLFACTNLARHLHVDPDTALISTNDKFKRRFEFIEQHVSAQNKTLAECDLAELDALWDQAKTLEKK
ncbi:nucleotide pyrophosphohydrolase [Methylophaga sp. 42_25_T18]|nr:nucleotide pyrophosphohydrolase [Methylophaga sp. 42_25_T18]OUR88847.1 nucleotide pyrophosphohydrolase [Methylophaga sp. 42_8_T64]